MWHLFVPLVDQRLPEVFKTFESRSFRRYFPVGTTNHEPRITKKKGFLSFFLIPSVVIIFFGTLAPVGTVENDAFRFLELISSSSSSSSGDMMGAQKMDWGVLCSYMVGHNLAILKAPISSFHFYR